MNEMIFVKSEP